MVAKTRRVINFFKAIPGTFLAIVLFIPKLLWVALKYIGSKLWAVTKHTGSKLWAVTKYTGSKLWAATKYIASKLWAATKYIASKLWAAVLYVKDILSGTFFPRIFNFIVRVITALIGLIIYLPTKPFFAVLEATRDYHQLNRSTVDDVMNYMKRNNNLNLFERAGHYLYLAIALVGNAIIFSLWTVPKTFIVNFFRAIKFSYTAGRDSINILSVVSYPDRHINRYYYTAEKTPNGPQAKKAPNSFHFHSQHLLTLALLMGVTLGVISLGLMAYGIFAPLTYLSAYHGINVAASLGLYYLSPPALYALSFATVATLTSAAVIALQASIFVYGRIGKGFYLAFRSERAGDREGIRKFFYQVWAKVSHLGHLIDQVLGIALGLPIYIVIKPLYQLLHSIRQIEASNRGIIDRNWYTARTRRYMLLRFIYKTGVITLLITNSIVLALAIPFQCAISLLYAPFQCVRHATKYGLAHTLSFPYYHLNNYRPLLITKDGRKYHGKGGVDYTNLRCAEYNNVYHFEWKHVLVLSGILGITLMAATGVYVSLGYVSFKAALQIMSPYGLFSYNVAALNYALFSFLFGIILTNLAAAAVLVAMRMLSTVASITSAIVRILKGAHSLNSIFHRVIADGRPFELLVKGQLVGKTIDSKLSGEKKVHKKDDDVKKAEKMFGMGWAFNIFHFFIDPSGWWIPYDKENNLARPIYQPQIKYNPEKTDYLIMNPLTGEEDIVKTRDGPRGAAKPLMFIGYYLSLILHYLTIGLFPIFPMWSKKNSISLFPNDGVHKAFERWGTVAVGVGMDRSMVRAREEFAFGPDAWTNLKWWLQERWEDIEPITGKKVKEFIIPGTTIQQLQNENDRKRRNGEVPIYDEILAHFNKEALTNVYVTEDTLERRLNALFRKLILKHFLGIDLPIVLMGANIHATLYSVEQQIVDLYTVSHNKSGESYKLYKKIIKHFSPEGGDKKVARARGEKAFVSMLGYSHHTIWASVHEKCDYKYTPDFKAYVKRNLGEDLDSTTQQPHVETHLTARVA